ncbi:hypothetical protein OG21DRAFT_1518135 [Imleria badia]|nr:hypothetical protein OG21DRAFT_1518135 [Imleria badia]
MAPTPMSTYHRRGSVLSVAPSIISNAPSTASGSSTLDVPSDSTQRRTKFERLHRKLGAEVPATTVFPTTPHTTLPRAPKTSTSMPTPKRSLARSADALLMARHPAQADDTRSLAFSISSDQSIHKVALSAHIRVHSPHPPKTRHVYQTGPLPPVPPPPRFIVTRTRRRRHREPRRTPPKDSCELQNRRGGLQGGNARQTGGADGGTGGDGRNGRVFVVDVSIVLPFPFSLTSLSLLSTICCVATGGAGSPLVLAMCARATSISASDVHAHVHVTR